MFAIRSLLFLGTFIASPGLAKDGDGLHEESRARAFRRTQPPAAQSDFAFFHPCAPGYQPWVISPNQMVHRSSYYPQFHRMAFSDPDLDDRAAYHDHGRGGRIPYQNYEQVWPNNPASTISQDPDLDDTMSYHDHRRGGRIPYQNYEQVVVRANNPASLYQNRDFEEVSPR